MNRIHLLATLPLYFLLIAASRAPAADSPAPTSPPPSPPAAASPTPTPVNAFLSLDVTAGDANTVITVSGSGFLPNEPMSLSWDPPSNKVAGSAIADSSGNFATHVKPFPGDPLGLHKLCASVPPTPCADFTLLATASPSPVASPSPTLPPSPSPSPLPTLAATPSPAAISGLDVMTRPPFVILPIIGGLGLAVALGYWILILVTRQRPETLKSVAVAHHASRPDYSAAFGAPPPLPAAPPPLPSAWADVLPTTRSATGAPPLTSAPGPPPAGATEASAAEASGSPAPESATPPAFADEPPDLPQPGDY